MEATFHNDGPKGKQYELVEVKRINNQNTHTETKKNPITNETNWEYRWLAIYKIIYYNLTQQ